MELVKFEYVGCPACFTEPGDFGGIKEFYADGSIRFYCSQCGLVWVKNPGEGEEEEE